jgi:hypothetical protein
MTPDQPAREREEVVATLAMDSATAEYVAELERRTGTAEHKVDLLTSERDAFQAQVAAARELIATKDALTMDLRRDYERVLAREAGAWKAGRDAAMQVTERDPPKNAVFDFDTWQFAAGYIGSEIRALTPPSSPSPDAGLIPGLEHAHKLVRALLAQPAVIDEGLLICGMLMKEVARLRASGKGEG